jgi:hypothetical protein
MWQALGEMRAARRADPGARPGHERTSHPISMSRAREPGTRYPGTRPITAFARAE